MRINVHDVNTLIIGCNDRDLLEEMQMRMDGDKVRLKNQIIIPVKSGPKIYRYSTYGIEWGYGAKPIVDKVSQNIQKRKHIIKKIRSQYGGEIKFDYDYKGIFPSVMDHQKIMFNIMAYSDIGAILADPGTCKTGPYLWAIDKRIQRGQVKKALIITLSSLRSNVIEELEKQTPHLNAVILDGANRSDKILNKKYKVEKKNKDYDIYVSNYESMFSLVDLFDDNYFDMVILDEAHRAGSHTSRQTKSISKKFENTKYKFLITGTLHSNNLMSFFMPFRILGPDTVPYAKFVEFRRHYMYAADAKQRIWRPLPGAKKVVQNIVGNISVVFKKEDCLDLPPLIRKQLFCEMGKDQAEVHKNLSKKLVASIEDMKLKCTNANCCDKSCELTLIAKNSLVLRKKLQQLESGFYIDTNSIITDDGKEIDSKRIISFNDNPKLNLLIQTLDSIPEGKQTIIWTNYTYLIEAMAERLRKSWGKSGVDSFLTCYKSQNAHEQVKQFQKTGKPFMLANPSKMGVGHNIQFSSYQIFFSNSESFIQRDQAEGRQHRKGQKEKVTVIDLITKGVIDKLILKSLLQKEDLSITLSELARVIKTGVNLN